MIRGLWFVCACLVCVVPAWAGEADVIHVEIRMTAPETYAFDVTVKHDDAGWEHYADRWQVLAPDGKVLGTRVLYHPHVEEQPFTRSLSGVRIPSHIRQVTVQARDSVHGWSGKSVSLTLPEKE